MQVNVGRDRAYRGCLHPALPARSVPRKPPARPSTSKATARQRMPNPVPHRPVLPFSGGKRWYRLLLRGDRPWPGGGNGNVPARGKPCGSCPQTDGDGRTWRQTRLPAIPLSTDAPTTAASLPAVTAQRFLSRSGRAQHRQHHGRCAAVRGGQQSTYPRSCRFQPDPSLGR